MTAPGQPKLDREEEAKLEISRTTVTPTVARTMVGGFLALCCAIRAIELTFVARGDAAATAPWQRLAAIPADASARAAQKSDPWGKLVAGNRAALEGLHGFEHGLEDEARIGQALRPSAQLFLTSVLGAGNEQAYIGRDGWLFYRRDLESVTGRGFLHPDVVRRRAAAADEWTTPPLPDPRAAITGFRDALAERGIELILLPVPVKPSVEPERLATRAATLASPPLNLDYRQLVEELRARGIRVIDPTLQLYRAAANGATQFLVTDTHWRPEAMESVAQLVADEIRRLGLPPRGDPGYRTAAADISSRGDIFAMLDLPQDQRLIEPESVAVRRVVAPDGSPWRSSPDADVLVLGDSFSNIYSLESMGWGTSAGFVEHLSLALKRPVDRIVQNDAAAYATRELLHRAGPERLEGKKVVVWQFAMRELAFGDWRVY